MVDHAYSDALSHSCSKLGNGDFVFKFVERIEDRLISDLSKPLVCRVLSRFCNLKFASKI